MGKKILLADDEEDIAQLTASRLSKQGYEVIVAVNGQEALELIRQHHPDLILLDYKMPLLNGLEVCQRVKADAQLSAIPVILFSASGNPGGLNPQALADLQVDAVVMKPFEAAELLATIKRFLG